MSRSSVAWRALDLDAGALDSLLGAAQASGLPAAITALFDGEPVNNTEGRAALHTALRSRSSEPLMVGSVNVRGLSKLPLIVESRAAV